jgi:hypothetical protein
MHPTSKTEMINQRKSKRDSTHIRYDIRNSNKVYRIVLRSTYVKGIPFTLMLHLTMIQLYLHSWGFDTGDYLGASIKLKA